MEMCGFQTIEYHNMSLLKVYNHMSHVTKKCKSIQNPLKTLRRRGKKNHFINKEKDGD
jgi:hypothetical protein